MMTDFRQRAGVGLKSLLPGFLLLLFVFMGAAPLRLPWIENAAPPLVIIGVYYWAIFQPDLMPGWGVFLIGLLQDLLIGLPPGLSSAVLVLIRWIACSHRRFVAGQSFLVLWTGFVIMALLAAVLEWALFCLLEWRLAALLPVALRFLMAIMVFPPLVLWGLHPIGRVLSAGE